MEKRKIKRFNGCDYSRKSFKGYRMRGKVEFTTVDNEIGRAHV